VKLVSRGERCKRRLRVAKPGGQIEFIDGGKEGRCL